MLSLLSRAGTLIGVSSADKGGDINREQNVKQDSALLSSLSQPSSPDSTSSMKTLGWSRQCNVDHERAQRCADRGLINFSTCTAHLLPIEPPSSSLSLLHAICMSLSGRVDFEVVRVMEDVLRTTMQGPKSKTFAERWAAEMKQNLPHKERQKEWQRVSSLVCDPEKTLTGIHAHVLAWILKRPILVISLDESQKIPRAGQNNGAEGLHLPLGQNPAECDRHVLVLGYTGSCFVPFRIREGGNNLVPLCDSKRNTVCVRFMHGERDDPVTVLRRYVDVVGAGPSHAPIPCTVGSSDIKDVGHNVTQATSRSKEAARGEGEKLTAGPSSPGMRYLGKKGRRPSPLRSPTRSPFRTVSEDGAEASTVAGLEGGEEAVVLRRCTPSLMFEDSFSRRQLLLAGLDAAAEDHHHRPAHPDPDPISTLHLPSSSRPRHTPESEERGRWGEWREERGSWRGSWRGRREERGRWSGGSGSGGRGAWWEGAGEGRASPVLRRNPRPLHNPSFPSPRSSASSSFPSSFPSSFRSSFRSLRTHSAGHTKALRVTFGGEESMVVSRYMHDMLADLGLSPADEEEEEEEEEEGRGRREREGRGGREGEKVWEKKGAGSRAVWGGGGVKRVTPLTPPEPRDLAALLWA